MNLYDLTLEGLERAINAVIGLDPQAAERLARLHGKVIRIELSGTPISLHVVPGHDGRLQLLGQIEAAPDATLSGSPIDLLRASDAERGVDELFAGRVRFKGDTGLAQRFSQILAGLDIDWEEQLAQLIGDIPAHELGRMARASRTESQRLRASGRETLSDYLTEEARLLPHRFEAEDFLGDVDTLRDDVARLEARVARLERMHNGKDK
jgi:ubiquinone biosynthesis protein UbiJ